MPGPRFLIIRVAALGDIALTSVLLSRIRAEHPDAEITWLCAESAAPLVRLFPVDLVITVDEVALLRGSFTARLTAIRSVWGQLAGQRFDRAFLVHADRRYRLLTATLRGTRVSALRHGVNPLPGRFRGDEYARLFDEDDRSTGPLPRTFPYADIRQRISKLNGLVRFRVALVPGGARNVLRDDALRRWPIANYRALAQKLVAANHEVVLIGDRRDGEALRSHFADLQCVDRFGTPLLELLADLRNATLLVTHDTGPLQLARLVRTPVIALFGPTTPRETAGAGADVEALWGGERLACRPCYDGRNYAACSNNICIQEVTVDAVFARVQAVLSKPVVP